VVCTLSPASTCCEETHNTLRFAARARAVRMVRVRANPNPNPSPNPNPNPNPNQVRNRLVVQEQLDSAATLRQLEAQARPQPPPTAHYPSPNAHYPSPTAHRPPLQVSSLKRSLAASEAARLQLASPVP